MFSWIKLKPVILACVIGLAFFIYTLVHDKPNIAILPPSPKPSPKKDNDQPKQIVLPVPQPKQEDVPVAPKQADAPKPDDSKRFKLADITIEITPEVAQHWEFVSFDFAGSYEILEGIVIFKGFGGMKKKVICAVCYDKNGSKSSDIWSAKSYAPGEKIKFKTVVGRTDIGPVTKVVYQYYKKGV